MTHKNLEKSIIFMFLSTGCPLLRAEGFSCSLGVLYGGLGISKLQFLIKIWIQCGSETLDFTTMIILHFDRLKSLVWVLATMG
jgi:hypothetical protein